jgi:hypothetical protein
VPIYDLSAGAVPERLGTTPDGQAGEPRVAFFAPDRPREGTVPVLAGPEGLRLGRPGEAGALCYALPADAKAPPRTTAPLYEYRPRKGGRRAYSLNPSLSLSGYERAERPLCLVWRRPG